MSDDLGKLALLLLFACPPCHALAARHNTWLLIKLKPKDVFYSFLFLLFHVTLHSFSSCVMRGHEGVCNRFMLYSGTSAVCWSDAHSMCQLPSSVYVRLWGNLFFNIFKKNPSKEYSLSLTASSLRL